MQSSYDKGQAHKQPGPTSIQTAAHGGHVDFAADNNGPPVGGSLVREHSLSNSEPDSSSDNNSNNNSLSLTGCCFGCEIVKNDG